MNEWASHHRVVPGVRRDAQTSASRSHTSVQTLGCARVARCTSQRTAELEGNGYSTTVSAEGNRLMNEGFCATAILSLEYNDTIEVC